MMRECLHVPVTALRVVTTLCHVVLPGSYVTACAHSIPLLFAVRTVLHSCVSEECVQIQVVLLHVAPSRAWSSPHPGGRSRLYRPAASAFLPGWLFLRGGSSPGIAPASGSKGGGAGWEASLPLGHPHPLFAQGACPRCTTILPNR